MESIGEFVTFDCILSEHGELEFIFEGKSWWVAMLAWGPAFLFWAALFQVVDDKLEIRSLRRLHRKFRCSIMKMDCLPQNFGRLETFRRENLRTGRWVII
jgi:hypothetical protein